LASGGGRGAAHGARFERLVDAFDALDGSDAFVHPDAMAAVAASGKARERDALEAVVGELLHGRDELADGRHDHRLFRSILESWAGEPDEVAARGAAMDVALVHLASMSNLVAAMGWYLVDLLEHPELVPAIRAGDRVVGEQAALESIRMAQRSIMARRVLRDLSLDVGDAVYRIPPGTTIATLLPVTNTEGPGYREFRPDRWRGRRLVDGSAPGARALVTTFGHGVHTCPAQPFSLAAMVRTARRLFDAYEIEPLWMRRPDPLPTQIGGVARPAAPCPVRYRARA
jgi:cytochrome P450